MVICLGFFERMCCRLFGCTFKWDWKFHLSYYQSKMRAVATAHFESLRYTILTSPINQLSESF